MIRLPLSGKWSQPNTGEKSGSIAYSKNINLDTEGFFSLSPRTVALFDDSGSVANVSDTDFDIPVALGRYENGSFRLATTDEPFNIAVSDTAKTIAEDATSNNPNLNFQSHGVWWQGAFYESTDTTVGYNTAGTWTASAISSLTSGVRHYLAVFKNKNSLAVSNGNTVKLYNTSHSNTVTLTLPTDFEVIGLAYNNYRIGIITRLGTDSVGQNSEAYFFTWDGTSTEATTGVGLGSYLSVAICPYKSSFIVIDASGLIKYYNGGGFDILAQFPFYLDEQRWGFSTVLSYGDNIVVDGDVVYINLGFDLLGSGNRGQRYVVGCPSGVWCYDPEIGLYHRYSPSISKSYLHTISQANVNTTTNVLTTSVTIPATGNPVIFSSGDVGGLSKKRVYYVIKLSSTTFSLAETKELAGSGVAIDVTSADTNNYFWMYDLVDYGGSYFTKSGVIGLWDSNKACFQDIIGGARLLDTTLSSQPTLFTAVPFLENRGYLVTPKLYLDSVEEIVPKIYIKHKPLSTNDVIVVKVKNKEYFNIPASSPNDISDAYITWTSARGGYTTTDLSEVKTAFDAGEEFELELTAGTGSGQMVKITGISHSSGTYALDIEEDVIGYVAGTKSHFIIDNWTTCASVTYSTQSDGIFEVPIAKNSFAPQFKIELRGYKTTVSDIMIINDTHKPAK